MKKESIHKESGRSMLEMVLVIAIMVLLIIAGLFGGQMLITGVRAQAINKHIYGMVAQRRLNMAAIRDTEAKRTENAPYDTELTIENGTGTNDSDYFWVSGNFPSKPLCEEIAGFEIENTKPDKVEINGSESGACPGTVKLMFSKFEGAVTNTTETGGGSSSSSTPTCTTDTDCDKGKLCEDGDCTGTCTIGAVCGSCDSTTPYWDGSDCVECSGTSCGNDKYCNAGICADCGTPVQNCSIDDDVVDPDTGCTTEEAISCSGSTPVCESGTNTCICPTNATCAEGNIVCTNTDETLITVNVSDKEYKICCPQGKTSTNGTSCNTDCTSGTVCASCPSATPLWNGTSCNYCPTYRLAKATTQSGGDAIPDYPGCYCPTSVPYWVDLGEDTDKGCYYSRWCYTNSDCPDESFCFFGIPSRDTTTCTSHINDGRSYKITGICLKATSKQILSTSYYTFDPGTLAHLNGETIGLINEMDHQGALNYCQSIGKEAVSVTEGCTTAEKNAIDSSQYGYGVCKRWNTIFSQIKSFFSQDATIKGVYFSEQYSNPCKRYYWDTYGDVNFRTNGGGSSSHSMLPLCK